MQFTIRQRSDIHGVVAQVEATENAAVEDA